LKDMFGQQILQVDNQRKSRLTKEKENTDADFVDNQRESIVKPRQQTSLINVDYSRLNTLSSTVFWRCWYEFSTT